VEVVRRRRCRCYLALNASGLLEDLWAQDDTLWVQAPSWRIHFDCSLCRDFYSMFDGLPKHEIDGDGGDVTSLARRIRSGFDDGLFRMD
jgi:hypothetical protein